MPNACRANSNLKSQRPYARSSFGLPITTNVVIAWTCRHGQQARADAATKRIERPCISCGAVFLSEGIHNRMGPCCRNKPGGWDPHNVAPRSGRAK